MREFDKEVESEISYYMPARHNVVMNQQQRQMQEGLAQLKSAINKAVVGRTADEYDKVLGNIDDLMSLAQDESQEQKVLRKIKQNMYVFKGKDIKTRKDKKKMVETRINHYHELHGHIERRNLMRQIRAANNAGDTELAQKLEEEFHGRYA